MILYIPLKNDALVENVSLYDVYVIAKAENQAGVVIPSQLLK